MCDHNQGVLPVLCGACDGAGVLYQMDGQLDETCPECDGAGYWWICPLCDEAFEAAAASLDGYLRVDELYDDADPSLPWNGLDR